MTKAVGITTEIGLTWLIGSAIILAVTPLGWVALAGAAIAEGVLLAKGGNIIENVAEEIALWAKDTARDIIQ